MPGQEFYSDDEAQQILSLANRSPLASGQGMSRDQILQTAAEMGISPEAVLAAEEELKLRSSEERDWIEYRDHVSRAFSQNVGSWIGTSILLAGINLLVSPGSWWCVWPIGMWGLVVLGTTVEHFFQRPWNDRTKFAEWRRKRDKGGDSSEA